MGEKNNQPDFKAPVPFVPGKEKELDPGDGKPVQVKHLQGAAGQVIVKPDQ
jgi:hypothetical protein